MSSSLDPPEMASWLPQHFLAKKKTNDEMHKHIAAFRLDFFPCAFVTVIEINPSENPQLIWLERQNEHCCLQDRVKYALKDGRCFLC